MKNKTNNKSVRVFSTTDPRLLQMSSSEHKEEVFNSINSNKINIDRSAFRSEKEVLSRFKQSVVKNVRPKTLNSFVQLASLSNTKQFN